MTRGGELIQENADILCIYCFLRRLLFYLLSLILEALLVLFYRLYKSEHSIYCLLHIACLIVPLSLSPGLPHPEF